MLDLKFRDTKRLLTNLLSLCLLNNNLRLIIFKFYLPTSILDQLTNLNFSSIKWIIRRIIINKFNLYPESYSSHLSEQIPESVKYIWRETYIVVRFLLTRRLAPLFESLGFLALWLSLGDLSSDISDRLLFFSMEVSFFFRGEGMHLCFWTGDKSWSSMLCFSDFQSLLFFNLEN